MSIFARFALILSLGAPALAWGVSDAYLTIDGVRIEQISDRELDVSALDYSMDCAEPEHEGHVSDEGRGLPDLNDVINVGLKIWQLIVDNKPVVNARWLSANAMPATVACWNHLTGWQPPRAKTFRIQYWNMLGSTVVDFTYRIVYIYNGSVDGLGRYLANVQVMPANLAVMWGYTFDAQVSVPGVVNMGTKESPVAGMQLVVNWKVKSSLKYWEKTSTYFVQGDGVMRDLSK